MSLIHEALQNVESYMKKPDSPDNGVQHKKNQLYKTNKFQLNSRSLIIVVLGLAIIFSGLYLFAPRIFVVEDDFQYIEENLSEFESANSLQEQVRQNTERSNELLISNENVIANDFTAEAAKESILKTSQLEEVDSLIDAINGDIAGSESIVITENISALEEDNFSLASNSEFDKRVVNVPSDELIRSEQSNIPVLDNSSVDTEYVDETLVAQVKATTVNYHDLQKQAYQLIVNKDYDAAEIVLGKILLIDANDYYASLNLALVDIQKERFKEAYSRLLLLKEFHPGKARVVELLRAIQGEING